MSERTVPEVRFRGFSGEWETDKAENLLDVCSGQDYKHLSHGNIPVYGTGGYMLSVDKALSYTEDAIGIGRKGTIDKPYILNAPFWTVDTLFYAIPKNQNDLYYLFCEMQKINWKAKDESTGVPSLSKATINATEFITSEHVEQSKIGEFFKNLDDIIAQNQNKYDKLVNMKKACLEKMFPKDGADTPEVRLQGFSGEWNKIEIGKIAKDTFGGGTPSTAITKYWSGNIPWIQSSDLIEHNVRTITIRKSITTLALKNSAAKLVPSGSIAIVTRVGVGKIALINQQYSTSQDFISLSNIDVDTMFATYSIHKKLQRVLCEVQGTSIKGITKDKLLNKIIDIPICETEQTKIGTFFQTLDNLITLRKTELEKLKNIKKACLDKMFI